MVGILCWERGKEKRSEEEGTTERRKNKKIKK
jgi:hypothetical protein